MKYWELLKEENEAVAERHELAMERIGHMKEEATVGEPYRAFFERTVQFIELIEETFQKQMDGTLAAMSQKEAAEFNRTLYADILPGAYGKSFANPDYAAKELGENYGPWLSFLYTEIRSAIVYAYESRLVDVTVLEELFIEVYNLFEGGTPEVAELGEPLYYFVSDYCDRMLPWRVRETLDPSLDFGKSIIMDSDLNDLRYLYRYGEYIGEDERKVAEFLNTLSEEEIHSMADTMTEGFCIGFELTGKDLSKKATVCMEYPIGFERVVRAAILNFEKAGLKPTIYRNPISSFGRGNGGKRGAYATSFNKQFEFDHRADKAFYLDKAYVERRLEAMKAAFEMYKKQANHHAGPAVMEIFGEVPFEPVIKEEAAKYSSEQNELNVYQMSRSGQLTNEYIPGDERSFTIIAYPIPAIGEQFEEIFRETVKINTLDYMAYRTMQQKIIDLLDTADKVHITGKGKNKTDLWVNIHALKDPAKETAFENCVADVNIPVGEVFTSPVLEGTNGKLHVTQVYLNELKYIDLELDFADGKVAEYRCGNFASEEENKRYIYENLLQQHDTLPMGEFAIGTNTTAYRMARKYQIADKLPILIAEKTGPHFAIGDTCYSHAEDTKVYNPDGKEIIARDNEISILRKEDVSKAYFNCHTDITIPYDELDKIEIVTADGTTKEIISDGCTYKYSGHL